MKFPFKSRIAGRYIMDRMSVNFLFIPGIMAIGAILLAWSMYRLDVQIPNEVLNTSPFIVSGSVAELRGYLFNMATTVLTTAGVVFTLLTLPLSTVAAQYGSRLLRIFLGDRTTQLVLGMFVATFTYCIFSAMAIPPPSIFPDGAQITTTMGVYLLIAAFASLILLIQHISIMLQAPNIAAVAGVELLEVVRGSNPGDVNQSEDTCQNNSNPLHSLKKEEAHQVRAANAGYIQYVDPEDILPLAENKNLFISIVPKSGAFIRSGTVLAEVWPADRVDNDMDTEIRNAFHLGNQRTPTQDLEYAVNQLTEMAVRAMSPAINDPFTAMTCLDYIGDGLALFARRGGICPNIHDSKGHLRVTFDPVTFDELLSAAFDMLRHASADTARVLLHMLDTIDVISQETKSPDDRQKLLRHVNLIRVESQAGSLVEGDRLSVHQRSEALQQKLTEPI
jgi:uncharacterized membrane protein